MYYACDHGHTVTGLTHPGNWPHVSWWFALSFQWCQIRIWTGTPASGPTSKLGLRHTSFLLASSLSDRGLLLPKELDEKVKRKETASPILWNQVWPMRLVLFFLVILAQASLGHFICMATLSKLHVHRKETWIVLCS